MFNGATVGKSKSYIEFDTQEYIWFIIKKNHEACFTKWMHERDLKNEYNKVFYAPVCMHL